MSGFAKKWSILLAGLVMLGGLVSAGQGIAALRSKMARLSTNRLLAIRLALFEDQLREIEEAKAAINQLESRAPADLDSSLRKFGLLEKVTDSWDVIQSLGDGWSALSREISIADVVLTDLDSFILSAQQMQPPWMLVKVQIRSSPFESGRGQVVLTMQALRSKQE